LTSLSWMYGYEIAHTRACKTDHATICWQLLLILFSSSLLLYYYTTMYIYKYILLRIQERARGKNENIKNVAYSQLNNGLPYDGEPPCLTGFQFIGNIHQAKMKVETYVKFVRWHDKNETFYYNDDEENNTWSVKIIKLKRHKLFFSFFYFRITLWLMLVCMYVCVCVCVCVYVHGLGNKNNTVS